MRDESWILESNLPAPYIRINHLHRDFFEMESHSHAFWQLIIVTDGQLYVETQAQSVIMYAGMIHILPPGCEHALVSTEGYTQLGIDLLAESDHHLLALLKEHISDPATYSAEQLLSLSARITELHRIGTSLTRARMLNLLESLLLHSLETIGTTRQNGFAEVLASYLDTNLHLPLRLSEIAEHFYLSIPQLERLCRRAYHCGVISQLQERRFRKAQQLLISTELSIQEIGTAVGYSDAAHFSGFFRSYTGISPRAYRQQSRTYA